MSRVIIYKSKTGHTERYARMLSEELNIPCYSYNDKEMKFYEWKNKTDIWKKFRY